MASKTTVNKTAVLKEKFILKRELLIREARKSFWNFCKLMNNKFYTESKGYLKHICDSLQAIYEGRIVKLYDGDEWHIVPDTSIYDNFKICKNLQLNMPPGFGKSFTVQLFTMWCLGVNIENEIITASYNEKLSERFGQTVRNGIEETKDQLEISYNDIFPKTMIKKGDGSKSNWSLKGRYHSYLATSFAGTMTGMRGNIFIIDDPIRDCETAYNENELANQWRWYTDTALSRMVEGAIQIVIMTRWSDNDICGKLNKMGDNDWYIIKYQAMNEKTGEMLCSELMSRDRYDKIKKYTSPEIFYANYMQITIDQQNRLYPNFKIYETLPDDYEKIVAVCDTSDSGSDYLAAIIAAIKDGQAYVLDIYYTQDAMEITENTLALKLFENNVNLAVIESNNGGRFFAKTVDKTLKEKYGSYKTVVRWFHQSRNKIARIWSMSNFVCENILFPCDWDLLFPEFFLHINNFSKVSKANKHDDCADALTMLAEEISVKNRIRLLK